MPSFAQAKVPLLCASLALMVAVSCSHNASDESPTGPSMPAETGGAVIAGTVVGDQRSVAAHVTDASDARPSANSSFAGLTVQVVGSSLSATVSAAGTFEISGVPTGNVRLQFRGNSINATTCLLYTSPSPRDS